MQCRWKCPFMYNGKVDRNNWPVSVKKCKLIEYGKEITYQDMEKAGLILGGECKVATLRRKTMREVLGEGEL